MLNILYPAIWICISIESIHNDSRQLECSTGKKKRLLSWCLDALSGCRSVGGRKFDEMSTLSLMINDQCSSQFHCFTKSLFWGGFLVQWIFHATLALGSWCDRWKVFNRKSIYVWYRCQTRHSLLITTRFPLEGNRDWERQVRNG